MNSDFYISRTLRRENDHLTEEELLLKSPIIIVLAEPGAGKSQLLRSLSYRLGVRPTSAKIFKSSPLPYSEDYLILDGLDEVASIHSSGLDDLIVKASCSGAKQIIMASRSSEWEEARTHFVAECFHRNPYLVSLVPLTGEEQKQLFDYRHSASDFVAFQQQVENFNLDALLGNPLFLELFSDAFVEGDGSLVSKKAVFENALKQLAHEANTSRTHKGTLSWRDRIKLSDEVFAVLLLSGAEGVTTADTLSEQYFPRLSDLIPGKTGIYSILDTRLFSPTNDQNNHVPVHRVIAEYSAAVHLAERIDDASNPLTLRQCIAIIAPNGVVREELRGLLSWLATVGSAEIQRTAIELDPYAILANGDPSQLFQRSKMLLLQKLRELSTEDPYFRGGDVWQSLNAAGVLTEDMVDQISAILRDREVGWQMKGLVLTLLERSSVGRSLIEDLLSLMLCSDQKTGLRHLAADCILAINPRDHRSDITHLLSDGDPGSLEICAKYFQVLGVSTLNREYLKELLLQCAELYPRSDEDMEDRMIGSRIFIKRLIWTINTPDVVWLLDELTEDLRCSCGVKDRWQCHCRDGISKIVGSLLDHYINHFEGPYDASQFYGWIKNLNFHVGVREGRSPAVKLLQTEHSLRVDLLKVFCDDRANAKVKEPLLNPFLFTPHMHQGLTLQWKDRLPLVQHAFATGNVRLWESMHHIGVSPDTNLFASISKLRWLMRSQAKLSSKLMRVWARAELQTKRWQFGQQLRILAERRRNKREEKRYATARKLVSQDRTAIEQGKNLHFLERIVLHFLHSPDQLEKVYSDLSLFRLSFRNCLPHLNPHLPSLEEAARLHGRHNIARSERVLVASCIEIFRHYGNLDTVSQNALEILMINIDAHVDGVGEEELPQFSNEVHRRLFQSDAEKIHFLRRYLGKV